MANLKTYTQYNLVQNDFVKQIPKDWELWKISHAFNLISSGTTPQSGNASFYTNGTVNWINTGDLNDGVLEKCKNKISVNALNQHSTLKIYPKGTLIIAMYGATIGKTAIMNIEGCTNQACCALSNSKILNNKFTLYWFIANKKNIVNLSYGGGQPNISQDVIKKLKIPVPPIETQNAIVEYLDRKNTQIDTFIAQKQRLIELLEEEKKSQITRILTLGLAKENKLKKTDIQYLPIVNEKYKIKRIKYLASLKGRIGFHGLKTSDFTNEGAYLVTGTDFINGQVNWESCVHVTLKRYEEDPYIQLREGDFLITKDGTIGKTAIVKNLDKEASLNSGVMLVRSLKNEYVNEYLFWIINSRIFDEFVEVNKTGSTVMHLYQYSFGNFKIPLPEIETQYKIIEKIDSAVNRINLAISKAQKEITAIQEYRQALIAGLVMGKYQVPQLQTAAL